MCTARESPHNHEFQYCSRDHTEEMRFKSNRTTISYPVLFSSRYAGVPENIKEKQSMFMFVKW